MSHIAFIGLGNMGTPMSRRLLDAGNTVTGFDPDEAARARLTAAGGQVATSAEAALEGADAAILMLPSSDVVDAVVDGWLEGGLLSSRVLVIDMSSSEPLRTRALHERVQAAGARMADAPVSGGVRGAEAGTLTIMLGADDEDATELQELLAPLGRVVRCGTVGAGHALKALNNLMSATHLWATSEAMLVGMRFGLDPAVMLEVVNGSSGRSGSTQTKWPDFILPGTYDSGFGLRLMLKDMRIAEGLARQLGASLELGDQAIELWARSAGDLSADADHTMVAKWLSDHAGDPPADGTRGGAAS